MNNAPFVPEGIPPMRVGTAARVLGFDTLKVRDWTRSGRLLSVQSYEGANRYVTAQALARFASMHGILPRWEEAFQ
jgi:hypothetical protein